jgi:hypothetical protein
MRGYRKNPSVGCIWQMKQKEKGPEKQTWEAPAATAAIRVKALIMTSSRVENLGGTV